MKEETAALLDKAERSIRNAEKTMEDGDLDFAASRVYYAMFYLADALLGEKDMHFSKHGGTHGAFAQHFVKTGEFDAKYQRMSGPRSTVRPRRSSRRARTRAS